MKYRADIDGLRALAVAPVVFYHVGLGTPGGFAGVDVFFVISGYLITAILLKEIAHGDFSIVRFYERRARRLFPALFAMLVVSTLFATQWLIPTDLVSYAKSAFTTLFFVSNIYFYTEVGYFNELAHTKPLLHTWSLGVEEQFYLVAPVIMAVLWRFFPIWVMKATIVVAVIVSFGLSLWFAGHHAGFYLPFSRAWELGIGMILALWAANINSQLLANVLGALGLVLLILTFCLASSETPWPGMVAIVPCAGAAAIILAGTNPNSMVSSFLAQRGLVGLGVTSH